MPFFDAFDEEARCGVAVTPSVVQSLASEHHSPAVVSSAFLRGALGLDCLMI